jgi:hypothetical protein
LKAGKLSGIIKFILSSQHAKMKIKILMHPDNMLTAKNAMNAKFREEISTAVFSRVPVFTFQSNSFFPLRPSALLRDLCG